MQTSRVGCFLTLTIAPEHMVRQGFYRKGRYYPPYSVYRRSLQLFFKRLRKAIVLNIDGELHYQKFRYLACGEYGEKRGRPHYHVALMGYDPPDKVFVRETPQGYRSYRSPLMQQLWPFGHVDVGELTYASAAYISRYTLKKSRNPKDYEVVVGVDEETGEILFEQVDQEFLTMSKGIGLDWWRRYKVDTDKDYLVVDFDKTVRIPRYYDKQREQTDPQSLEVLKQERERRAVEYQKTDDWKRRLARAKVKDRQNKYLKRNYDNG